MSKQTQAQHYRHQEGIGLHKKQVRKKRYKKIKK